MPTTEPFNPPGLASTHKEEKIRVERDFGGFLAVVIDSPLNDTRVGPFSVIGWLQLSRDEAVLQPHTSFTVTISWRFALKWEIKNDCSDSHFEKLISQVH